jgi:pimeloyl-ACP methyl ester carboxylesterase
MFSETRYALNGDLRVAYRASREGPRDIVFVPNTFTCCEILPDVPSIQGWLEAMTSLGRLIFFDQPGTGASDPVTSGALPTLEQCADSVTAVLDDLESREAVVLASDAGCATAVLFAATHPSRTTALVVLEGFANPIAGRTHDGLSSQDFFAAMVAVWWPSANGADCPILIEVRQPQATTSCDRAKTQPSSSLPCLDLGVVPFGRVAVAVVHIAGIGRRPHLSKFARVNTASVTPDRRNAAAGGD